MCKDLHIKTPTTPVVLSTSIPHYYQYEQHPEVLKQWANIVAQFLDGIQILIYMSVTSAVKFGASVVIFMYM